MDQNDYAVQFAALAWQIHNIGLVLCDAAENHFDMSPNDIWAAQVNMLRKAYNDLKEVTDFLGLEVKEV